VPLGDSREAVDDDDAVDDHVCHGTPEAEPGDVAQTAQKGARQQYHSADQDPRGQVQRRRREHADHQFTTQQHVENARHQQFDQLSEEHQSTAGRRAPDRGRDVDITTSNSTLYSRSSAAAIVVKARLHHHIILVQTLNEDLPGVAADPRHDYHRHQCPVSTFQHRVWKTHYEHALQTEHHGNDIVTVLVWL